MKALNQLPQTSPLNFGRQTIYRPKIVGGDEVKDRNVYPWMTALVAHGVSADRGQFCGGALIAPNWVLTAAHCPYGNDPDDLDVVLGIIDLRRETPEERIAVAEIIIHPQYDPNTSDCDLALLRLSKASQKQPVSIISSGDPEGVTDPERPVIAIGWGATFEGGPGTKILRHVEVPVVSYNQAKEAYGRHGAVVTENMLSAGYPEGGKDACQGDSGGPLIAVQKGQKILVGATSWGIGCARPELPGLYARLSVLGDWAREAISRG